MYVVHPDRNRYFWRSRLRESRRQQTPDGVIFLAMFLAWPVRAAWGWGRDKGDSGAHCWYVLQKLPSPHLTCIPPHLTFIPSHSTCIPFWYPEHRHNWSSEALEHHEHFLVSSCKLDNPQKLGWRPSCKPNPLFHRWGLEGLQLYCSQAVVRQCCRDSFHSRSVFRRGLASILSLGGPKPRKIGKPRNTPDKVLPSKDHQSITCWHAHGLLKDRATPQVETLLTTGACHPTCLESW